MLMHHCRRNFWQKSWERGTIPDDQKSNTLKYPTLVDASLGAPRHHLGFSRRLRCLHCRADHSVDVRTAEIMMPVYIILVLEGREESEEEKRAKGYRSAASGRGDLTTSWSKQRSTCYWHGWSDGNQRYRHLVGRDGKGRTRR